MAMAWRRRPPIATRTCRRCGQAAVFEVSHAQFGVRVYCREHFMRTVDVPPGAGVRWV